MIATIKCILKFHDDLSQKSVFEPTDQARQAYYNQAVGIRELIGRIKDEVVSKREQDKFQELISDHTKAVSRGLLWDRKVDFEDN